MILYINTKEAKGKYIVINDKNEEAQFSLEGFKEWIMIWLNKLKDDKKK